jgi:cell fate (sporulation/competence/biofilm development) regulator YlbF (YheA/YmcA/DUF963 family)
MGAGRLEPGSICPCPRNEMNMQTTVKESPISRKTRELCQAILDQPDLQAARQRIETFMADDKARALYEGVMSKGQTLHRKQQSSQPLNGEEISSFEKDREALLQNPVARGFLDAQEELHHVHESVNRYVSKTLELGRVPTEADLEEGGCGEGCSCGHGH